MGWTQYHFCCGLKKDDRLITVPWFYTRKIKKNKKGAYLNEWVDYSNVRTGIKHFVEVGLSVDEFELVELLIVLEEKNHHHHQVRQISRQPRKQFISQ